MRVPGGIHFGLVGAERHLGVHCEQRLLVVADRVDHHRAPGDDSIRELDESLHICVDPVQVGLGQVRCGGGRGHPHVVRKGGARGFVIAPAPRLDVRPSCGYCC
jgi:hypothetical protein